MMENLRNFKEQGNEDLCLHFCNLPEHIILQVVQYLSLRDVCQLAATCQFFYYMTHTEHFWRHQLLLKHSVWNITSLSEELTAYKACEEPLVSVVHDPESTGSMELFCLYSSEVRAACQQKEWKKKRVQFTLFHLKPLFSLIANTVFGENEPQNHSSGDLPRIVLLGPGLESPKTKYLVHNIVNGHNSTFEAVGLVPGMVGGIGSGVKVHYRGRPVNFMCLYSNTEVKREQMKGDVRLAQSKLMDCKFTSEEMDAADVGVNLNPLVQQLLSTVDGLMYAIDASEDNQGFYSGAGKELGLIKTCRDLPVLVLSCVPDSHSPRHSALQVIKQMNLLNFTSSWNVCNVEVNNMRGVEIGLDWLLHFINTRQPKTSPHQHQEQGK